MLGFSRLILALTFAAGLAGPAGAQSAKLFTVDFSTDGVNDLDGSDDLPISFTGSSGVVDAEIRAVNVTGVDKTALTADIAFYVDFGGNFPGGADFTQMDTLIFDVVVKAGSAPIDEIAVSVATVPTGLDPDGAGYLNVCTPAVPLGCRSNVPVSQLPDSISLSSGGGFHPGASLFGFGKQTLSATNLEAGETSIRLFVAWEDFGGTDSPLGTGQAVKFMMSSGINEGFSVTIAE